MPWTKRQLERYYYALLTADRHEQELHQSGLLRDHDLNHAFYQTRAELIKGMIDKGEHHGSVVLAKEWKHPKRIGRPPSRL